MHTEGRRGCVCQLPGSWLSVRARSGARRSAARQGQVPGLELLGRGLGRGLRRGNSLGSELKLSHCQ